MDASGREHLFLNFYIKASPTPNGQGNQTYWDKVADLPNKVTNVTWDGTKEWAEDTAVQALEKSKASFKYLVGSSASPETAGDAASAGLNGGVDAKEEPKGSIWKSAGGIFGGLRGAKGPLPPQPPSEAEGVAYTEGEVHVDLVKVCSGVVALGSRTDVLYVE